MNSSMLRKTYWMSDEEYQNVACEIGSLTHLARKWKNHACVREFLIEWEVDFASGTYALEGEAANEGQMVNFMLALRYTQSLKGRLASDEVKSIHELLMRGEPVLVGEFRQTPAFAGYHEFAPVGAIRRLVVGALSRYYSEESDDPILNAVKLFIDMINIHPFEDGNGRLCRLIISHVLTESGMSLFPVLLSSFHRRGRRHYIQAVKRFGEKPSLFYTMVCQSLVKVWEDFEGNL